MREGIGVAIFPRALAARLSGIVEVAPSAIGVRRGTQVPSRDLWMVVHRSKQRVPRVRAVMRWVTGERPESATGASP